MMDLYTTTPQKIDAITAEIMQLCDTQLRVESTRRLHRLNAVVEALIKQQANPAQAPFRLSTS